MFANAPGTNCSWSYFKEPLEKKIKIRGKIKIRKKTIAFEKFNHYRHTMSRAGPAGYTKVYQDLGNEKNAAKKAEGALQEGDEEIIFVGRHEAWKRGHTKTKHTTSGLYRNTKTMEVAGKIV